MPLYLLTVFLLVLVLLLIIQTSRLSFWRGRFVSQDDQVNDLCKEIEHTRSLCNLAQKRVDDLTRFITSQHQVLVAQVRSPELTTELIEVNGLLRSFRSVVEREGHDTNWDALEERLDARLRCQHGLLFTPKD